jgi:hypothetical protein
MSDSNGSGSGIGFGSLWILLFMTLKLIGVYACSWWFVFAPLWVGAILVAAGFVVMLIIKVIKNR